MTEQQCKKLIKQDLQDAAARCQMLIYEIDESGLNDVDMQLARLTRQLMDAQSRLKHCDDY